jgi:hypothetical protein
MPFRRDLRLPSQAHPRVFRQFPETVRKESKGLQYSPTDHPKALIMLRIPANVRSERCSNHLSDSFSRALGE